MLVYVWIVQCILNLRLEKFLAILALNALHGKTLDLSPSDWVAHGSTFVFFKVSNDNLKDMNPSAMLHVSVTIFLVFAH